MNASGDPDTLMHERVRGLVVLFTAIGRTRMSGVPVMHPALHVEAVGFEVARPASERLPDEAVGILITPWFMNLVCLPLRRVDSAAGVGRARPRPIGDQRFDFIGAYEAALGAYGACSLFSPMFEFADQPAACATARAALDALRRGAPLGDAGVAGPAPALIRPTASGRRTFLFGRGEVSR